MPAFEELERATLRSAAQRVQTPGGTQRDQYFPFSPPSGAPFGEGRQGPAPLMVPSPECLSTSGGSAFASPARTIPYDHSPAAGSPATVGYSAYASSNPSTRMQRRASMQVRDTLFSSWESPQRSSTPREANQADDDMFHHENYTPIREGHFTIGLQSNRRISMDDSPAAHSIDRNGRLRYLYHRRLTRRCFFRWMLYTKEESAHSLHLEVRRRFMFLAMLDRMKKQRVFRAWRLWNGNPAQFHGALALLVNRNKRFLREAFRAWRRHTEIAKENDALAIRFWRENIKRRVLLWWKHIAHESDIKDCHLKIRLQMFKNMLIRSLKLWAITNWKVSSYLQDMRRWQLAADHWRICLLWKAFQAWRQWAKEKREDRDKLNGAWQFFIYTRRWSLFKRWREHAAEMTRWRKLMKLRAAINHWRQARVSGAFAAWLAYVDAMRQRSRLVTLSAIKSRMYHYFHAWRGYLEGYHEGMLITPGGWSVEELLLLKHQVHTIGFLLVASTARRNAALLANFKAARLWELLVRAFRGWAFHAVNGYESPERARPPSETWYPIIRLIRVVHVEWALRVGEESWYKGLHDAQLVWHAWQVWRRFIAEQRLEVERKLLLARRWYESRLAWRAFQAWVRYLLAYKLIRTTYEEARLLQYVAFQNWCQLAMASLTKRRRVTNMIHKKQRLIQQAFFNTWRRTTERACVGRRMKGMVAEVEDAARSAQADNDALRAQYQHMLEQKAADEEEAAQERDAVKKLCAQQHDEADMYKELMERALSEAEVLQKRRAAAEAEAASEKERADRLAAVVRAEEDAHDALHARFQAVHSEARQRRALLVEEIAPKEEAPAGMSLCDLRSISPHTPHREERLAARSPTSGLSWQASPTALSPPYVPRRWPETFAYSSSCATLSPSPPLALQPPPSGASSSPPFLSLQPPDHMPALPSQPLSPPRQGDHAAQLLPSAMSPADAVSQYTIDLWETGAPGCTACKYNTVCLCGKTAPMVRSSLTS
eukprot:jgi/Tetstr1/447045/TSEL_003673.t1